MQRLLGAEPAGITEACGMASTYLKAASGWVSVICSE